MLKYFNDIGKSKIHLGHKDYNWSSVIWNKKIN